MEQGGTTPQAAPDLIKETTTQTFVKDVIEESRRQPVMIDFWAPWCGPCRQLTPILEKAVKNAKGRVKLVKMNIDEHPQIPGQMGIQSIPAVIAFVNGQPADGFMGAVPESQVNAFIEKITKGVPAAGEPNLTEILAEADARGCEILLPIDVVIAPEVKPGAETRTVLTREPIGDEEKILDAGPLTVEKLIKAMALSKTLIWNGPLGVFEVPPFDAATVKAAKAAADLAKSGALVAVAGGGDTVAALNHAGVSDEMTFVSTAGGAFLEWMEGKVLPGVEALRA